MKYSKESTCAAMLAAGVVLSASVHADNCSGVDVVVSQSAETTEIGKGALLIALRSYAIVVADTAASPFHLMTGECDGTLVVTPDNVTRGAGFCLRKDKDGDTMVQDWTWSSVAQKGTWKHLGGTGKFVDASSSGWWTGAVTDGKMTVNKWGGNCK
jgi:hypothetical protein